MIFNFLNNFNSSSMDHTESRRMIKKLFLESSWIKFELVKFQHVRLIHLAQAHALCYSCTINDHDAFNLVYSPLFALHDHLSRCRKQRQKNYASSWILDLLHNCIWHLWELSFALGSNSVLILIPRFVIAGRSKTCLLT